MKSKVAFVDSTGARQEVQLSMDDYKQSEETGLSLAQHVNRSYDTDGKNGTVFAQMMASAGLFMQEDRNFGIRPPTLKDIFDGKINMGTVVERPDGSERFDPAGRLLFPAVMLEMLESSLRDNRDTYNATFMRMVGETRTINSPKYDQIIINYTAPQGVRSMPISQLAEPVRMLTITTAKTNRSMPVYSLGMEISKEALAAASLDQVGIAVREQGSAERSARLDEDFSNIIVGDVDSNEPGLMGAAFTATSLDASLNNVAGALSQDAWVMFLRKDWRKRTIAWVVCDLKTYLKIEKRSGRITTQNTSGQDERLNPIPNVSLPGVPGAVNVFIVDDGIVGANTLVGLDPTKAMRLMRYVGADYSAVEEFVMRKSLAFRMDWSERIESAGYPEAFSVMTLT